MVIADAQIVLEDVHLGDSISCNGVCLTVTDFNKERTWFKIGCSPETLKKTNLGKMKVGMKINLERACSGFSRYGGHYVQGHVDTTIVIESKEQEGNSIVFKFKVPETSQTGQVDFLNYIVPKGYVSLDGTSLTVIDVDWKTHCFTIMMIAYTQEKVVLAKKDVGDHVNLEVDQIGKYVENMVIKILSTKFLRSMG